MFYINRQNFYKRRDVLLLHLVPTAIVFSAFFGVALLSWSTANNLIDHEKEQALQRTNNAAAGYVKQRLNSYESILRGASGLFEASPDVDQSSWQQYLGTYGLEQKYPEIQSVGFAKIIPKDNIDPYITTGRQSLSPSFDIFPRKDNGSYTSTILIYPTTGNLQAVGYDMSSDSNMQMAMSRATNRSNAIISDLVSLDPSHTDKSKSGFIMYLPIFKKGTNPQTIDERQKDTIGYTYISFKTDSIIDPAFAEKNKHYSLQIYNHTLSKNELVYKSPNFESMRNDNHESDSIADVDVQSATWEIIGKVSPEVVDVTARNLPSLVIRAGTLLSFSIALFIYLLLLNRSRLLAEKEAMGIQYAKDELLALASHQLRTPATGVKQYVGMLLEGFADNLTTLQKQLLHKAYESNERQLSTINEMLVVAQADAGHLSMRIEKFNLSELARDIAEEYTHSIKLRKQTQQIKILKRPIYVLGDKKYLRMAFENIISNATKYTPNGGNIEIIAYQHKTDVIFKVKDTGVGVAPKDRGLLFTKFSRIPNELTNKVSGSGIGLYLTKKIIDRHNGKISFESAEDQGTTVSITLPTNLPEKQSL
jgi:signal transduction histidine kinase